MDAVSRGEAVDLRRSLTVMAIIAALLAVTTLGTLIYLATEDEPGWDGVFLWASLAAGWGFVVVGFANAKKPEPSPFALWFAWMVYLLMGFGGVFAMTAYWLAVDDEIYSGTYVDLVIVIVTSGLMLYAVMAMTRGDRVAGRPYKHDSTLEQGWHVDPTGSHEARFYDGERWTARVRDGEQVDVDLL